MQTISQLLQHTGIKSTHTTIATQHPCLYQVKQPHSQLRQSNLFFTPDPAEYNTRLNLQINITRHAQCLHTDTQPKILGLTVDLKVTYNQHIDNTAAKTIPMLKCPQVGQTEGDLALNICSCNSKVDRSILEYASTI